MLDAMSKTDATETVELALHNKNKNAPNKPITESVEPKAQIETKRPPEPLEIEPYAKPRPSKKASAGSKLFSLMISLEDIEKLKKAAKNNGEPVAALIRAAIKNHLIHYK